MLCKVLIFSTLILCVFGDNSYIYNNDLDCEDHIDKSDENGTLQYHNFVTTSVRFYFFPPDFDNETVELNSTNLHLVNLTQPTKIIVHGIGSYEKEMWIDKLVQNYHTTGDYNVIAVDWSVLSTEETFYVVSAVDEVGRYLGDFIMDVTQDNVEYLSEVHLIGSSYGAQIAGVAGETVANKTNKKVDRITGLDPTVPENVDLLDQNDAEFVDVIHTTVFYGEEKCGTVDFYVLGEDFHHPICFNDSCGDLLADDYFVSTIVDEDRFEGMSCYNGSAEVQRLCDKAKTVAMGEHVPRNISGSYLVKDGASGLLPQPTVLFSLLAALVLWHLVV